MLNCLPLLGIKTLEFRIHSGSWEFVKISNWAKFVIRFCARSIKKHPEQHLDEARTAKQALELCFKFVIRDDELRDYYFRRANAHQKRINPNSGEIFEGYGRVNDQGQRITY